MGALRGLDSSDTAVSLYGDQDLGLPRRMRIIVYSKVVQKISSSTHPKPNTLAILTRSLKYPDSSLADFETQTAPQPNFSSP